MVYQTALVNELASGNLHIQRLVTEYAHTVGRHIGNLVNIFNPEAVIIGGEIAKLEQFLAAKLEQTIEEAVHPIIRGSHRE